jgi:hypothetical protein
MERNRSAILLSGGDAAAKPAAKGSAAPAKVAAPAKPAPKGGKAGGQ